MMISTFARSASATLLRSLWSGGRGAAVRRRVRPAGFRPAIDRLESRVALAVDTLSIGGQTSGSFRDFSGDEVFVSIAGSAGTAVFRDANGGIVDNGDDIATVSITGASPDFQLTFGASRLVGTGSVGPLNNIDVVTLGRITADSVIRGINTVASDAIVTAGGPSAAVADPITFTLESFRGVNFSKGGGLFVDRVTGDVNNLGIELVGGFSPYATIAIRESLDAVVLLGTQRGARADGRLLIESATSSSLVFVNASGDTSANSKLQILGGSGPFDAGVGIRGAFAGVVNLGSPAGGTWLFEGNVASSAVLSAASWQGLTPGAPVTAPGVAVRGNFAGKLESTNGEGGDVVLTVGGNVAGTARVNSAAALTLLLDGRVLPGAQVNSRGICEIQVGGDFSGAVSAGDDLSAFVGGNLSGAKLLAAGDVQLIVGIVPVVNATSVSVTPRNIVNSSVVAASDIRLSVSGDVVKSSFVGRNIVFSGLDTQGDVTISIPPSQGIRGSVRNSAFTAGGGLAGLIGGSVASSALQAQIGMEVDVLGGVSQTRFVTTENQTLVSAGRDFQGWIQGGVGDVWLSVGGSVLKGTSLLTGGNAEVNVTGNFNGAVDVGRLRLFVDGNVAQGSRIVAREVSRWSPDGGPENFRVGGRFDGVLTVGVFDAADGDVTTTIIGGGAGTSARFYVDRFETDTVIFAGDFRGNVRVLQDLVAGLVFTGNIDRITIGGQVRSNISVGGTLLYLNSNSWFQPTGPGKQSGLFMDGQFAPTGVLSTGRYVTVVPVRPTIA